MGKKITLLLILLLPLLSAAGETLRGNSVLGGVKDDVASCFVADDVMMSSMRTVSLGVKTEKAMSLAPFGERGDGLVRSVVVSGSLRKSGPDYVVRIILKDRKGGERLILESYEELTSGCADELTFSGYGEETLLMDGVDADNIVVFAKDAVVELESVSYSTAQVKGGLTPEENRKRQVESIVGRINRYNVANRKLWRAAVTDVSLLDYGTKKRVVGIADGASSLGIEYYGGGIFEMGSHADMARSRSAGRRLRDAASSPYVDHFDWRDRHGKNWITSVKHQGNSGYCVAFASVGVVEALVNLYFNDTINLDLSEQEVAVCNGRNNVYTTGMYAIEAIDFLRYTGVCDEISYPFADSANVICRSDEITPIENVKISGYHYYTQSDDNIKSNIISKGPQLGGIGWFDTWEEYNQHAMALVGYNTLHAGDTIRILTRYLEDYVVIDESDPRIGSTYWMYKNSYGVNGPDMPENQGYCYVIFNNTQRQIGNISFSLPIIRAGHTDAEIICEDRDGDGIYNWGIGPKPATCPNQTQMKGDGDDSDPLLGEINTFGYCENLNPDERDTIFVTTDSVTTDSSHVYNHIVVCNGATWTVSHNQTFHNGAKVFVREGAHLDMTNSAAMRNADVRMFSGTQMLMNDNSFYKRKNGKAFNVPSGAKFILNKGKIK